MKQFALIVFTSVLLITGTTKDSSAGTIGTAVSLEYRLADTYPDTDVFFEQYLDTRDAVVVGKDGVRFLNVLGDGVFDVVVTDTQIIIYPFHHSGYFTQRIFNGFLLINQSRDWSTDFSVEFANMDGHNADGTANAMLFTAKNISVQGSTLAINWGGLGFSELGYAYREPTRIVINATTIPEPGSISILLAGALAMYISRTRRREARSRILDDLSYRPALLPHGLRRRLLRSQR